MQIFLSLSIYFSLQTDQLLSARPAGLIGFVFSTACFQGCLPPEHILDKHFPSQFTIKIPTNPQSYKGPLLPNSKKGKFREALFSALPPASHSFCFAEVVSLYCRIKSSILPCRAGGAGTQGWAWRQPLGICRLGASPTPQLLVLFRYLISYALLFPPGSTQQISWARIMTIAPFLKVKVMLSSCAQIRAQVFMTEQAYCWEADSFDQLRLRFLSLTVVYSAQ